MINVIGLGYIGLPTALMLAANGNQVVGTDHNAELVEKLNRREAVFEEEGLKPLFLQAVGQGIQFTCTYQSCEMYIVAVPTPYQKASKQIDPKYVVDAVAKILEVCPKGAVIVIESTVSPKTVDRYIRPLVAKAGFADPEGIHLVHAPERIIPGNMVYELQHNSRAIGADSPEIAQKVRAVYETFCKGEIVLTDIQTAEMSKIVENTFRDINIAYANELAKICHAGGLDVYEVIRIANMHPRVQVLSPGPGVGGHCISVDPWFLVGDYPQDATLIRSARTVNDAMPAYVMERILQIMKQEGISDIRRVGLYGLSYKENVDDTRESPSLQLLSYMQKYFLDGAKSYDPYVKADIVDNQYHDLEAFLAQVDMVVVMAAHNVLLANQGRLEGKVVFDTRNRLALEHRYCL